jgi:hypothetical protein
MITLILIISLANLGLQMVSVWQRHEVLKHHKQQNGNGVCAYKDGG